MKVNIFLFSLSRIAPVMFLAMLCTACAGAVASSEAMINAEVLPVDTDIIAGSAGNREKPAASDTALSLERIAELERAGSYFPGLGLAESTLREKAGDYAGAAVAAYKELSWAYGNGSAAIEQVGEGLQNAISLSAALPAFNGSATEALKGCMAFAEGDWERAEELLEGICSTGEEPDSFLRWMLLVCVLEKGADTPAARQAYGAIRARYASFPEYWYRGARAFSPGSIAASYAEQCINVSPRGPFAADCRRILADHLGLISSDRYIKSDICSDVLTRAEIEFIIRASVSMNNPAILEELYPLMALPENPYTLYAMGALKALAAVPEFRSFFIDGAVKSPGRLGERLTYIARG